MCKLYDSNIALTFNSNRSISSSFNFIGKKRRVASQTWGELMEGKLYMRHPLSGPYI